MSQNDDMTFSPYVCDRLICSEKRMSKHINVLTHIDDHTLLDKNGFLIQLFKLSGLNYVTTSVHDLDRFKNRRNHFYKNLSSEFAIYSWEINARTQAFHYQLSGDDYIDQITQRYYAQLNERGLFQKQCYLALISKQAEGWLNSGFNFIEQLQNRFDHKAKQAYLIKKHQALNTAGMQLLSHFSDYDIQRLSVYQRKGVNFSAPLEVLSQLINGESARVPLLKADASVLLPRKRIAFNRRTGVITLHAADQSIRYAAILSIKAYASITYQGLLDELNALSFDYLLTQSYRPYDRQDAKSRMRDQQFAYLQSQEESITQTEQIDEAFDEAAGGELGYGKHHLSLLCYANSNDELNQNISAAVRCFANQNITCVREDMASELTYWAQLPGNFAYIGRAVDISTRNVSGFASFHNEVSGKASGNHWGNAVTVFETRNGRPYHFNFHYKDIGNFLVYGSMGSGKTVLISMLILQSMQFGGKRVIFDKDRGMELMVRYMDGIYHTIKPGRPTGFNPCQLADTAENRQFLFTLFSKLLTTQEASLNETDNCLIERAIDGLYRLDALDRQLCHLASFFGSKVPGSLRARFDQWHSEGAYAWLFDHKEDELNLNPAVIGFDIGHILDDEVCKTPALMYLIYRVEQALENQRGVLFIDEAWKALTDNFFKRLFENWSRTLRKLNNIFGLATQVANDTCSSHLSKVINESACTKFFFPNPLADRDVYINRLGVSERDYELITTMTDHEHYFLLIHGRGASQESVEVRMNLEAMPDVITILSAREESLAAFDQIKAEVGEEREKWYPLLIERMKRVA